MISRLSRLGFHQPFYWNFQLFSWIRNCDFTNVVRDRKTLFDWISDLLNYGTGRNDGCFVVRSFNNEPGINDLCLCLSAGKERLIETLEMGQAFIRAVNSSYNLSLPGGLAFPVAVGAAAQKWIWT